MELYRQGYKTMICNAVGISDREREYLDMLERNMVDGIITGSHILDGEEYLKQKKPIVSIDRDFGSQIPIVGSDHRMGENGRGIDDRQPLQESAAYFGCFSQYICQ